MAPRDAGTPATLALTRAGIPFTTHAYDHDPRSSSYGLEAAAALGLDPAAVFKTLVAEVDGSPVVAIVPVSGTLDLKALAAACGGRRADLAEAATAQRLTGYVVGGISPIGQRRPLPTLLDESAILLATVYVSGGRRGLDIGLAPDDLLAVTGGAYAAIGRAERS
ncbi:MAG: Cys-tRNA(Pro)/Cys-tRNA(Cys) deacylase [Actinomycetota bacterium]|nr:Cys-tRNA(Pro)/Cys-tRNA(Cys) deacylase [Actinomycetota bacterium]